MCVAHVHKRKESLMPKFTGVYDIHNKPIHTGQKVQALIAHYDFSGVLNAYPARNTNGELIQFVVEDYVFSKCIFQNLQVALQTKGYDALYVGKELEILS